MGNCLDCRMYSPGQAAGAIDPSQQRQQRQAAGSSNTKSAAKPESAPTEKPRPLVFAIMRNGHEVIRGSMEDVTDAIVMKKDLELAKETYHKLTRWMELHKRMEEGNGEPVPKTPKGMFALLDEKFDLIAQENKLRADHDELEVWEHKMEEACKSSTVTLEEFHELWTKFAHFNEQHLKKEEKIMMPRVVELKNQGENLAMIMKAEIMPLIEDDPDMEFWVKYANQVLDVHHGNMPRARVFDHALWAVSDPQRWKKYEEWIREVLPPKRYIEIYKVIHPDMTLPPGIAEDCL